MGIKTRKGRAEDIPRLREIEKRTTPGNLYLYDCREEFLDDRYGELVVAEEDGEVRGFAHFSLQPDGSAWLECLRVDPEHQKKGCGTAIWKRFMELCEIHGVTHVGMYTGEKNYASRTLGERNGLKIDYRSREGVLEREKGSGAERDFGFERVTDTEQAKELLSAMAEEYGGYFSMNRTFNRFGEKMDEYLVKKQSLWRHGDSAVILGSRFLPERGLYIPAMTGDIELCADFAVSEFQKSGLPKLFAPVPSGRERLTKPLESRGFVFSQRDIIVLERDF